MNQSEEEIGIYYYKQTVDNKEEVIALNKCYVNLGIRLNIESDINNKSDDNCSQLRDNSQSDSFDLEMTQIYFNESDTESYESEENSLSQMNKQLNEIKAKPKKSFSKNNNKNQMKSKRKQELRGKSLFKEKANNCQELNLTDNLFNYNNELFMSQSLSLSQISSLILQNGKFTYFSNALNDSYLNETTIKLKQNVEYLLKPLISEENSWRLLLKIINEDIFAFRKPSKDSIELVQKVLSHYNWSDFNEDNNTGNNNNDFMHFKQMHIQFITSFMREISLSCYSRDDILSIISGSTLESNAWTFVSQLITYIILQTVTKRDDFSIAFIHLTLIIDLLTRDFEIFLRESNDYCIDICRIERNTNFKPLVVRLIWSTKNPNYINSVLKHLVYLIVKAMKVKNDLLLIELFKLFELCAESLRIGSGNVRPLTSFGFNKSTLINELFQQLSSQSFDGNELKANLLSLVPSLSWAKLQLCTHIMSQFVDFQTKFSFKKFQISLDMIICYIMNGNIYGYENNLSKRVDNESPLKPMQSTPKSELPRKRSSLGLFSKSPALNCRKSWSKKNLYGENSLHIACKKGDSAQLKQLLQLSIDGFGCDPNETDNNGYSPLCEAAFHGDIHCVKELIDWEKKSNKKLDYELSPMTDRQTALHDAIENDSIDCSKLIIENGGIQLLEKKRNDGKTPKDLIKSMEMKQMIETIIESKCKSSAKININSVSDAQIFVTTLTEMIASYIETTKIDHFIGLSHDLWPNKFNQLFSRDPNETDINYIVEDLKSITKLPNILKDLKKSFKCYPNINGLVSELEIAIDCLLSH